MSSFTELDDYGRAFNRLGYSKPCPYKPEQQIHLVAEYYANRIKPERIAYRTGIDIKLVTSLVNGELRPDYFNRLLQFYRRRRRNNTIRKARQLPIGTERIEAEAIIEKEYLQFAKEN